MRLDQYLVLEKHAETRSKASDLIKRKLVFVNGKCITKTGFAVDENDRVEVEKTLAYVSRAGLKLEDAYHSFNLDFKGLTVIDVGSSTGGFTDFALKKGAKKVYAYDVGKDQMDQVLRKDERIKLFEQTNILDVDLPNADMVTIDVSFTSILPILKHFKGHQAYIVALIKPQFEVGPKWVKKGIVKDQKVIEKMLLKLKEDIDQLNFNVLREKTCDLKGKMGNQEYIFLLKKKLK